jgi:hypothetical protein
MAKSFWQTAPVTPPSASPQGTARPAVRFLPWLAMAAVLVLTALELRHQGRRWWCACGRPTPWSGDAWGPHNSQHFLDPYSFTHVLHGLLFCGLLAWALPWVAPLRRLCLALGLACLWEVWENSAFVIERYRAATAALGYEGDTVANSMGDVLSCGVGFLLALRLGLWRSVALFLVTEAVLLLWIRDDLLLNVVMLIHPVRAIKAWQTGQ